MGSLPKHEALLNLSARYMVVGCELQALLPDSRLVLFIELFDFAVGSADGLIVMWTVGLDVIVMTCAMMHSYGVFVPLLSPAIVAASHRFFISGCWVFNFYTLELGSSFGGKPRSLFSSERVCSKVLCSS